MLYRKNYEYGLASAYYFHRGEAVNAYEFLGSHRISEENGVFCYSFICYEKDAARVELVGNFNDRNGIRMTRLGDGGLWYAVYESRVCIEGTFYEYRVRLKNGKTEIRPDPFAQLSFREGRAISSVNEEMRFCWSDKKYMSLRRSKSQSFPHMPVNVYELTLREGENYRELAERLSLYSVTLGYTHVKLVGGSKKAFFGCFTPSSSHGSPDDFAFLVDILHSVNVGVMLELPVKSSNAEKPSFELPEMQSLLFSTAVFWLRNYHIDGFFVDTDVFSSHTFLMSKLSRTVFSEFPDVLMIANDNIGFCDVTSDSPEGFGFSLKKNTGWTRDMLDFLSSPQSESEKKYNELTFSSKYAFSERFLLCLDTRESGKTLADLICREKKEKWDLLRAFLTFFMCYPGKKLICEGCEYGKMGDMTGEADSEQKQEELRAFSSELNRLYLNLPCLYEYDSECRGFEWVRRGEGNPCAVAFRRFSNDGELLCIFNFTGKKTSFDVPKRSYKKIFDSTDNSEAQTFRLISDTDTVRVFSSGIGAVILDAQKDENK